MVDGTNTRISMVYGCRLCLYNGHELGRRNDRRHVDQSMITASKGWVRQVPHFVETRIIAGPGWFLSNRVLYEVLLSGSELHNFYSAPFL